MELNFLTAELRDICEIRAIAIEMLGPVIAVQLAGRLADIEAVDSVDELVGLYPDEVAAIDEDLYKLQLSPEVALALGAGNVNAIRHGDGKIDWSQVDRLLVTAIEVANG